MVSNTNRIMITLDPVVKTYHTHETKTAKSQLNIDIPQEQETCFVSHDPSHHGSTPVSGK